MTNAPALPPYVVFNNKIKWVVAKRYNNYSSVYYVPICAAESEAFAHKIARDMNKANPDE